MQKVDPKSTSFRLSGDARRLLAALAAGQGLSKTAALEVLIRKAAKDEGISTSARSAGTAPRA